MVADGFVFGPRWNKAPVQHAEPVLAIAILTDYGRQLAQGYIVLGILEA
jgi:hypothetical protein